MLRMKTSAFRFLFQVGLAVLPLAAFAYDFPTYAPDAVLVAFKPEADAAGRHRVMDQLDLIDDARAKNPYFHRLLITSGRSVASCLRILQSSGVVRVAEPDWIGTIQETIPNDTRFSEQWALRNTGQSGGTVNADIDASLAWDRQIGDQSLIIAFIDTGMSYNHVDLNANAWLNVDEILGNGVDDDANGYVDDVRGYDFVNSDGNPVDDHGHGTQCAGIAGAVGNNGIGIAGICWNVKLMPIKCFNSSGVGFLGNTVLAIDYARLNGAKVISNSYAFNVASQLQREAIERARDAGIVFVAGAGNNGFDTDLTPVYPAGFSTALSNVISVGATNRFDERASFSNFGSQSVDFFAPGVDVLTTYPGNVYVLSNGTSMSCPHGSGAAALLLAEYPTESPADIRERLRANADRVPTLQGLSASGRLNVNRALIAHRVQISGVVDLQDFVGNPATLSLTIVLRQNGFDVVVIKNVSMDITGSFSFTTTRQGIHDIVVKAPHWLAKKHPNTVQLGVADISGLIFSLPNGDSDADNEVGIGDYALLSASYGSSPGDLIWDARADLNGDETVDIADYAILSMNFGMPGD